MEDKNNKKIQGPSSGRVVGIKEKKEVMVNIKFKENRKFDLHVGRKMLTFRGRESKPVPESWLTHKDFLCVQNLFIIKKGV